jgi:hypothetical protein
MRQFEVFVLGALLIPLPVHAAVNSEMRRLHLGPASDRNPYVYVPFSVPLGAEEITVRLNYDHAGGDNAIDFAIFDATFSGREDDLTGYRGKNPNREPLISVIGRTRASDGHLPGPLPAGTWRVMFYVYKTKPEGVDVTLTISIASDGGPEPDAGPRWLKGDLHAHTVHSDGTWTVSALAAAAQEAGLDFIAITDHNVSSHHREVDAMPPGGPLLLHGIELTTAGGHMNIWGVPSGGMVEHRMLREDNRALQSAVTQAHSLGALISINHPFAACKACDWAFDRQAANFDGIEVWNGSWGTEDEKALDWWKDLILSGRRITAIGSSDSHGPQADLGGPAVSVYARRDEGDLLQAIRSGRVVIGASPRIGIGIEVSNGSATAGPGEDLAVKHNANVRLVLRLDGAPGGTVILYSAGGEVRRWVWAASFRQELTIPANTTFFRLEARDQQDSMIALTNPVWLHFE